MRFSTFIGSKAGAAYVKAAEHYMQADDSHDAARRFADAATSYQKTEVDSTFYGDL